MTLEKTDRKKYLLQYTLVFAVFSCAFFIGFILHRRGFIWRVDGQGQYIPGYHFVRSVVREFVSGLLSGNPVWRMYDFRIGLGDDISVVFLAHPDEYLSALFPAWAVEYFYYGIILERLYLAGLSFSAFCFYWGKRPVPVLCGTVTYLFCGQVLKQGIMHPNFLIPMILFPLLLLTAEKMMRGKAWRDFAAFAAVTAAGLLTTYYFFYMCTIALPVYVLLRFWDLFRKDRVREFMKLFVRMICAYLLGVGMSMAVFLPTLCYLFASERASTGSLPESLLFYAQTPTRYYRWFLDLITPYAGTGYSTNLNYLVLVIPALVLLFIRKKKRAATLRTAFVIELAFLLIPLGAWLMNGLTSSSNRWIFLLSFTLSFIVVFTCEDLLALKKTEKLALAAVAAVYAALSVADYIITGRYAAVAGAMQLTVCVMLLCLKSYIPVLEKRGEALLLAGLLCSAGLNGFLSESTLFGGYVKQYMPLGSSYGTIENCVLSRLAEAEQEHDDQGFFRCDSDLITGGMENYTQALGYRGTSEFNSLVNSSMISYMLDQESRGMNAVIRLLDLDGRTVTEELANVRYYLADAEKQGRVPYGFEPVPGAADESAVLYENRLPLSFGYSYDRWISREAYEKLSPLAKQQVMLDAAVTEQMSPDSCSDEIAAACEDRIICVPAAIPEKMTKMERTEDGVRVLKKWAKIRLPFERRAGYECYLRFIGLDKDAEHESIRVKTGEYNTSFVVRGEEYLYSLGKRNYTINLGYSDQDAKDKAVITFLARGDYALEGFEFIYVPLDSYEKQVADLNENGLEQVTFGVNTISGETEADHARLMAFSLPYKAGWQVTVDGEKAQLQRVNVGYCGVYLESGRHRIELKYEAPGAKAGWILSLLCCALWCGIFLSGGKINQRKSA